MHATDRSDCLDANSPSGRVSRKTRAAEQADRQSRRAILCAACDAQIADSASRIEVGGRHEHTFFNPAGVVYRVVCFASAPGCGGVGPFAEEFSWFPGWRWQVALCASCLEHLGWHFDGDGTFIALIENRIREADVSS